MSDYAPSQWRVSEPGPPEAFRPLAEALNIPMELATLLVQRGIREVDEAKLFLRPSLGGLSDPFEFKGMAESVELIRETVRARGRVMVHGDYDVDGQCATALLTRVLRVAGADVVPFVPNRITDGYDLGPAGVQVAQDRGVSLIVTCDCGTTAVDAVARAKAAGMRVIVTDHHLPSAALPAADAIVNPRQIDCPSTSKELCGAGIAFKLAQALVEAFGLPQNLPLHLLDHVALATVADLVPLVGENRTLVRFGLKALARSRWPGLQALVDVAGLGGKPLRAGHVGFILGPRLNAVGRIRDAKEGLALLLCDDPTDARARARALDAINEERQELDRRILDEAVAEVEQRIDLQETYGLVLAREGWHPGVIGIVASRVVERFARPTFMIGVEGEVGKGSGRSIPGFDLHQALGSCAAHLVKYGGHKMAAGLTVERDAIPEFARAFNEHARSMLSVDDLVHTQRVDAMVSVDRLDGRLERLLRHMEPCGIGNPAPIFAVSGAWARGAREVGNRHLRFTMEDGTGEMAAIAFGFADRVETNWLTAPVDVAFRLEENEWNGSRSLQARVVDLKPTA